MHSVKVLSAIVAMVGVASAATCDKPLKISQVDTTIDCETFESDITVSNDLGGTVTINGPKEITGGLFVQNNTKILGLASSTISKIGGEFKLEGLDFLGSVNFQKLSKVNKLTLSNLRNLPKLTLGSNGITEASDISIIDTGINDLTGLNLATVGTLNINSNSQLKQWSSDITNITKSLIITANVESLEVTFPELEFAADVTIGQVKNFSVPSLKMVDALRINKNPEMISFSAANLTTVGRDKKAGGSLAFNNNTKLEFVSLPSLTTDNGDLNMAGNDAMTNITGFPELKTVFGALVIGGIKLQTLQFPKLTSVEGGATITSKTNLSGFCDQDFKKLGGKGKNNLCTPDNENANKVKKGDDGNGGKGSESAGVISSVSFSALSLGLLVGAMQLL